MHIHHLADSSGAAGVGGFFVGILILGLIVAMAVGYNNFKVKGFRPRTVTTKLSTEQLRAIFRDTVARAGWSIVDEGNPIVAQSSPLLGIRQQIGLELGQREGGTVARIMVLRYSKKVLGGATKAYTLRWRMTSFLSEVQRADARASVVG